MTKIAIIGGFLGDGKNSTKVSMVEDVQFPGLSGKRKDYNKFTG